MTSLPEVAVTESLLGDGVTDEIQSAPAEPTSATQRASARRRAAVRDGVHPLALIDRAIGFHPQASRKASADDPRDLPFTCGTCTHRRPGTWAKCALGPQSRGTGTDVRRWWPACSRYTPTTEAEEASA